MRALVIGGSGFIGLNLVDALIEAGHTVRVTRRKRTVTLFLRQRGVELVEASLEDAESLRRAMDGCDTVFLVAGYYPRYSLDLEASLAEGIRGVRNACEAARAVGVRKLVYTSTVGTLAPAPPGRKACEDDIPSRRPEDSVYRAVKWEMERVVDDFVARGLPAVTLLPGGCIGPWDMKVGTGGFLVGVIRGELPWWVDGVVNLVDVGDVALAHVRAADAPAGKRYCVAGHDVRVGWLLHHVVRRYGGVVPAVCLSPDEARSRADEDESRAAPIRARVPVPRELVDLIVTGQPVSSARAERELGIRFRSLDDALDRAHAWFVRFRYLSRRSEPSRDPRADHRSGNNGRP